MVLKSSEPDLVERLKAPTSRTWDGEFRHDNLRLEAAAEIERLRQQLWLAREDLAHLVQQIDAVLGPR